MTKLFEKIFTLEKYLHASSIVSLAQFFYICFQIIFGNIYQTFFSIQMPFINVGHLIMAIYSCFMLLGFFNRRERPRFYIVSVLWVIGPLIGYYTAGLLGIFTGQISVFRRLMNSESFPYIITSGVALMFFVISVTSFMLNKK